MLWISCPNIAVSLAWLMLLQSSMDYAQLPLPLLVQILQKLSLQQRLGQAALVCKPWAAAAAAATVHVHHTLELCPQPAADAAVTGLVVLKLEVCAVPSAVLAGIPQLQQLYMQHCTLLPMTVANHRLNTEGTAALLAVLQKLRSLQHLQLVQELDTRRVPAQHFSALTASNFLTELSFDPMDHVPLPRGAALHMFPAGRQLSLLRRLIISPEITGGPLEEDEWCLDSADLASICKGCPGLQWLDIASLVQPGADLSGLLQLAPGCKSLLVGGAGFADAAAPVLAQLTQLDYLAWSFSPKLTDAGLEQLTALTGLTRLCVHTCDLTAESVRTATQAQLS